MINHNFKSSGAKSKDNNVGTFSERDKSKRLSGGSRSNRRSLIFKNGIKSKSLDIFDRPVAAPETVVRKSKLKRYRSLASIPENTIQVKLSPNSLKSLPKFKYLDRNIRR